MPTYTCVPCGFSSTYKSSYSNHLKTKKHSRICGTTESFTIQGEGDGKGDGESDSETDLANAILFLEAKDRLQESRIARLEEIVKVMAKEIDTLKKTPMVDTQNNTTNNTNVNLLLQLNVDTDNKLTVGGGMQRIPNLPDTVRDQLENALPVSINTLFAKNSAMAIGCESDSQKEAVEDMSDESDTDSFYDEPNPKVTLDNIDELIPDEFIRESIRKLLIEEDEYNRECAREVLDEIVEKIECQS